MNEALTKTTAVRDFEEVLSSKIAQFRQKQGLTIAIRLQMMRSKMVDDLDELIESCVKTEADTKMREDAFLSILTEAEAKMQETSLQLVNLAANEGQLFLI